MGPGIIWQKSIYKGTKDKIIPIPVLSVRKGRFSFNGINTSYSIYKSKKISYSAGIGLGFSGFSPKDSEYLSGMREKEFQLNFLNSAEYFLGPYSCGSALSSDVKDLDKGWGGEVFMSRRFALANSFLSLKIKGIYESSEKANFNYGVYKNEAVPGRPYYLPGEVLSFGADLSFLKRYKKTSVYILISLKELNKKITASPIVSKKRDLMFLGAYSFNF